jgi:hypothetical protein
MLLDALQRTPDSAKWNVIRRLGEIGDFNAVPALTPFLAHSRADLQSEAREAIGEIEQRIGSKWSPPPPRATAPPPPPPPAPVASPPRPAAAAATRPAPPPAPRQRAPRPKRTREAPRPPRQAAIPVTRTEVSASEAATTGSTHEGRAAGREAIRVSLETTVVTPYQRQPVAGLPDLPGIGEIAEVGALPTTMPDLPPLADLPPAYFVAPPPA